MLMQGASEVSHVKNPPPRPLPHLVDLRTKQYIDRLREL
jgi:hypothetical protein